MELKDVILSTLAEMEDDEVTKKILNNTSTLEYKESVEVKIEQENEKSSIKNEVNRTTYEALGSTVESELIYLNSIRERLLVLFEGFQAPNNKNIEAKVDMTLNFLEYVLATIDSRVQLLEKGHK